MQASTSRGKAFAWIILSYVLAIGAGFLAGWWCREQGLSLLTSVLIADVVGTLVVFAFSFAFDNSSFYDPYWSVIPMVIAGYLAVVGWDSGADPVRIGLLLLAVSLWGLRLTYNWARGWPGLHHQDWRYDDLQAQNGRWYWLVSLSGIHLFPTVLVFLGCLPLFPAMTQPGRPLNGLDGLALLVALAATLIEFVADNQLRQFKLSAPPKGSVLTRGLWAYSRHPNYFGEVMFWWGLFLFGLAARPDLIWPIVGALSITLLFEFISIPMIERRMRARRPDYDRLTAGIPRWIPWPWARGPKRS